MHMSAKNTVFHRNTSHCLTTTIANKYFLITKVTGTFTIEN